MRTVRLGDIVAIQLGKMLSPASKTGLRPMPYLRNANVQWDRFDLTDVHEMDFDIREEQKFLLKPGDVLVCEGGEPGRAAVWTGAIDPCLYQKALHRLRPISDAVDPQYLVYRLWHAAHRGELGDGQAKSTIAHLPAVRLAELLVRIPKIGEQRRIAARLTAQIAAIDQLRRDVRRRRAACDALVIQLVRSTISRNQESTTAKLSGVAEMRRSPSVTSDGDVIVRTVTSGCLTPTGFSTAGFSTRRMTADAAVLGVVNAGEVLVARSNTEELVGRAALYPGGSEGVVASDLIFRIAPDPARLMPEFLAHHLAGLQLSGYWRNRSSGASSTMKKITKTLLWDLDIPIPPLEEQLQITEELQVRLASIDAMKSAIRAEQEAIDALPAALLRLAFEGLAA